jgi:hypothetical protein
MRQEDGTNPLLADYGEAEGVEDGQDAEDGERNTNVGDYV